MSLSDFYLSPESLAYMEQVAKLTELSSARQADAVQQRREALVGAGALASKIEWHPLMNLLPTADELPPIFPAPSDH